MLTRLLRQWEQQEPQNIPLLTLIDIETKVGELHYIWQVTCWGRWERGQVYMRGGFADSVYPRTPLVAAIRRAAADADPSGALQLISEDPVGAWFAVEPEQLKTLLGDALDSAPKRARAVTAVAIHRYLSGADPGVPPAEGGGSKELWPEILSALASYGDGDPSSVAARLEALLASFPDHLGRIDTTGGELAFLAFELGVAQLLAGSLHDALASLHRVFSLPEPRVAALTRGARALSALIHALFGDPELSRVHLDLVSGDERTRSWAEARIDAMCEVSESLLERGEEGIARVNSVSPHVFAELWPLHAVAVHALYSENGYHQQALFRLLVQQAAHRETGYSLGYPGSVFALQLGQQYLLAGDIERAREHIGRADSRLTKFRLLSAELGLVTGEPATALDYLAELDRATLGLRRMDVWRSALVSHALVALDRSEDARVEIRRTIVAWAGLTETESSQFPLIPANDGTILSIQRDGRLNGAGAETPEFTSRELQLLHALSTGASRKQIAGSLFLSENTVKSHIRSLYRKLGARSREEALTRAARLGLLN